MDPSLIHSHCVDESVSFIFGHAPPFRHCPICHFLENPKSDNWMNWACMIFSTMALHTIFRTFIIAWVKIENLIYQSEKLIEECKCIPTYRMHLHPLSHF